MITFKVPTVFSAIDKVSKVVRGMKNSVHSFASSAEVGIARGERAFRRMTPVLSETTSQMFAVAKAAAIAGLIIGGLHFSGTALMDYEDSVASFRTIVGGSDKEFSKFQGALNGVANTTRKSSIDVFKAAENIAGLNAEFAKTPESISEVTKATIILSKAARMELGDSAASLVGIMNQFSLEANQADRAINVLAAGQAVGAASISQTAESFKNFGSVAAGANISLEQSVGLIQTLGKFSVFGAEAGTKLRGSILKLQQAGVGYASGQFNINDALAEARARIDKLGTAKAKDAALTKMFGAENISTGRILLENIDLYKKFALEVTGTDEAFKAAALNSNTLWSKLKDLQAVYVNFLTTSDNTTTSLSYAKDAVVFLTNNLSTLIGVGLAYVASMIALKAILVGGRIALFAYNVALGVSNAIHKRAIVYSASQNVAMKAQAITTKIVTAAQWAWNAAMTANPIGLIITGVAALVAAVVLAIKYWDEWGAALSLFIGPLGWIISLFQSFRRNWDMIVNAFKTEGIIGGLKAIGKTILDAFLMPVQQLLELVAKFTGAEWATNALKNVEKFRKDLGVNMETEVTGDQADTKPAINPEARRQEAAREIYREHTNSARVQIDLNDPGRFVKQRPEDTDFVKFNLSSTHGGW